MKTVNGGFQMLINVQNNEQYETNVITGDKLVSMCSYTKKYGKRECMDRLESFLESKTVGIVCLIYGLRRTGKTTMVLQAISSLPIENTAYIKIIGQDKMANINRDLKKLQAEGFKYIFIDEVTLMEDFIDSASLLSDVYAMNGMKIVLSGTDSLGFAISAKDELYDRCMTIHTTFIPFSEYSRLLGIHDIDEYIRYGGTFRIGETNFDDIDLRDEGISFRDDESTRRYVDTAIAHNIQHSLECYQNGCHFRHLIDLYEAGELTSAINRIIEDMNHRFLVSVLTKDFKSHDLGSSTQIDRKRSAVKNEESVLDNIDVEAVTKRLMEILDIKNKTEMTVKITQDHVREIKEYLRKLDLIIDCPMESIGNKTPLENILFTQPGMRYCQAQSLVFSLMKDETFKQYDVAKRDEICRLILEEVRGRMLEDIVLIEIIKSLPSHKRAFKLIFDIGEYDMVISDSKSLTCEIYEIKHSDQIHKSQYRYLVDDQKCKATEFEYGKITGKYVLYRGENVKVDGIQYLNVVDYLENKDKK
jgi:predicted AAA+ superfamily ATPase